MKIRYKNSYKKDYHNNPDRNYKLSKYKLSSTKLVDPDTEDMERFERSTSPTIGYYEFLGIISGTDLQISLCPPDSDFSVESYKEILVYYEDIDFPEEHGLAFVIDLEEGETLRRATNLIDISGFNPIGKVVFTQSKDTTKLEGVGQGRCRNVWTPTKLDLQAYITRESWIEYRQLIKETDAEVSGCRPLDHLDITRINEFGLKIY